MDKQYDSVNKQYDSVDKQYTFANMDKLNDYFIIKYSSIISVIGMMCVFLFDISDVLLFINLLILSVFNNKYSCITFLLLFMYKILDGITYLLYLINVCMLVVILDNDYNKLKNMPLVIKGKEYVNNVVSKYYIRYEPHIQNIQQKMYMVPIYCLKLETGIRYVFTSLYNKLREIPMVDKKINELKYLVSLPSMPDLSENINNEHTEHNEHNEHNVKNMRRNVGRTNKKTEMDDDSLPEELREFIRRPTNDKTFRRNPSEKEINELKALMTEVSNMSALFNNINKRK
jgi:hypothetical protein